MRPLETQFQSQKPIFRTSTWVLLFLFPGLGNKISSKGSKVDLHSEDLASYVQSTSSPSFIMDFTVLRGQLSGLGSALTVHGRNGLYGLHPSFWPLQKLSLH